MHALQGRPPWPNTKDRVASCLSSPAPRQSFVSTPPNPPRCDAVSLSQRWPNSSTGNDRETTLKLVKLSVEVSVGDGGVCNLVSSSFFSGSPLPSYIWSKIMKETPSASHLRKHQTEHPRREPHEYPRDFRYRPHYKKNFIARTCQKKTHT